MTGRWRTPLEKRVDGEIGMNERNEWNNRRVVWSTRLFVRVGRDAEVSAPSSGLLPLVPSRVSAALRFVSELRFRHRLRVTAVSSVSEEDQKRLNPWECELMDLASLRALLMLP